MKNRVHPGGETQVSISYDYEKGSGSTPRVKLSEKILLYGKILVVGTSKGLQRGCSLRALRLQELLKYFTPRSKAFSGGMKTELVKHQGKHRECVWRLMATETEKRLQESTIILIEML